MRFKTSRLFSLIAAWGLVSLAFIDRVATAAEPATPTVAPIYERFAAQAGGPPNSDEVPDFQRHVTPLLGRLGCNGRACHGSFQGQGGFRLSLFGYDFKADHEALLESGAGRVDLEKTLDSLILTKPVDADAHEGGKRFEKDGWEYWVLRRWIESRATYDPKKIQKIQKLEVTPTEIRFTDKDQKQPLKVIAHWEDGSSEDVTCLCRFQSNDTAIAAIDEAGLVASGERGDTHVVVSYDNAVVPIVVLQPLSAQVDEKYPPTPTPTNIDRLVVDKLKKLGIVASEICTDEEFLRRASLDVTGTLPTAKEVMTFTTDRDPEKRAKKIEEGCLTVQPMPLSGPPSCATSLATMTISFATSFRKELIQVRNGIVGFTNASNAMHPMTKSLKDWSRRPVEFPTNRITITASR